MRHLLLAALLVAMTGCGSDTKQEDQPTTPTKEDQPTAPEETVSSPETPNGSDEPSAKAGVPAVNSVGMRFVPIQAGTFTMGEEHYSQKAHQVTLTQAFELGVYEVTQEQYEKVMGTNPSNFKSPQNPVEKVSWDDAVEFCRKLSELPAEKKAGYVYRLPTEAEWEYACRAGTKTTYSFGDSDSELGDYAWYNENSGNTTHPVGQKKPNRWGLYDMHGNVWEWCQDWYGDYPSGAVTDPTGAASGSRRVLRGGSSTFQTSLIRSANRYGLQPVNRTHLNGFRPAQNLPLIPLTTLPFACRRRVGIPQVRSSHVPATISTLVPADHP